MKTKFILFFLILFGANSSFSQIVIDAIKVFDSQKKDTLTWQDLKTNTVINFYILGQNFDQLNPDMIKVKIDSLTKKPTSTNDESFKILVDNSYDIQINNVKIVSNDTILGTMFFTKTASTGPKTISIVNKGKSVASKPFFIKSNGSLPSIQSPISIQSVKIGEGIKVEFSLKNAANLGRIYLKYGQPTGGNGDNYELVFNPSDIDIPNQKVSFSILFKASFYLTQDYYLIFERKDDPRSNVFNRYRLSSLFAPTQITFQYLDSLTLYNNFSGRLLLQSKTINIASDENTEYSIKDFNSRSYSLIYQKADGYKTFLSQDIVTLNSVNSISKDYSIGRNENGNLIYDEGLKININVISRTEFGPLSWYDNKNNKLDDVPLIKSNDGDYYIGFTVKHDPKVNVSEISRYQIIGNTSTIKIDSVKTIKLDQDKHSVLLKIRLNQSLGKEQYQIKFKSPTTGVEFEKVGDFVLKQFNVPLSHDEGVLKFKYRLKNSSYQDTLLTNISRINVFDWVKDNQSFSIKIDLSDSQTVKKGKQHLLLHLELLDDNGKIINEPINEPFTLDAGKTLEKKLSEFFPQNQEFKAWYSLKVELKTLNSASHYNTITDSKETANTVIKTEIVFANKKFENNFNISFPLQQFIVMYNKNADLDKGDKKWIATPFSLAFNWMYNKRNLDDPKNKYKTFCWGHSLLVTTTKITDANDIDVGAVAFAGFRFQNEILKNPNVMIGGGYSFRWRLTDNYSDFVPLIVIKLGIDID